MKKIIVFIFISCLLISCKKVSQCYNCTYGSSNGYVRPPDTYCGPMPYQAKDNLGNNINTSCVLK